MDSVISQLKSEQRSGGKSSKKKTDVLTKVSTLSNSAANTFQKALNDEKIQKNVIGKRLKVPKFLKKMNNNKKITWKPKLTPEELALLEKRTKFTTEEIKILFEDFTKNYPRKRFTFKIVLLNFWKYFYLLYFLNR